MKWTAYHYCDEMTTIRVRAAFAALLLSIAPVALMTGCATQGSPQTSRSVEISRLTLPKDALAAGGLAFLTPSTVTGQEEDKQALALSFHKVLAREHPSLKPVALPVALTAINRAGLAADFGRMIEDYRITGLFDRSIIRKVGAATGTRYLAQLKLAGFRQESKNRWGALGFRIFDTKASSVRLFLQIWDSSDGAIVWEGAVELTAAYDSISEETVTFDSVISEAAQALVERLP